MEELKFKIEKDIPVTDELYLETALTMDFGDSVLFADYSHAAQLQTAIRKIGFYSPAIIERSEEGDKIWRVWKLDKKQ